MAEPLGSTPRMEKTHGKAAKPSKEPARKRLIQKDWDSKDEGKENSIKKSSNVLLK